MKWVYGLVDMQSFYASCEVASDPRFASRTEDDSLSDPALIVAGDPKRRSGIVLAATPTAKKLGVDNAMRLGEALRLSPGVIVVRPRMDLYLQTSVRIQQLMKDMFPLQEQFSVDEAFIGIPAETRLFPDPVAAVAELKSRIWDQFRIRARVGLGPNKWMAKMANNLAKKHPSGIVWLKEEDIPTKLHSLPVHSMWGLKKRADVLQKEFKCETIGDVSKVPLNLMRHRFGIWGEVIWKWANGQDHSELNPNSYDAPHKGISHRMTLPRDYYEREEICTIILELLDEVCVRVRKSNQKGRRIGIGLTYGGFTGGFYKARTMDAHYDDAKELYPYLLKLLDQWWTGDPVRAVGISLDQLQRSESIQMSLFEDVPKRDSLLRTMDGIHEKFGETSLFRGTSLTKSGQLFDRTGKIGGHYA